MKKIGIMGGTFNPIHYGHLIIAESAFCEFQLDEILFIPTGCPYLKDLSTIADSNHRLMMTLLAIENNSYFKVSDIEIKRAGNSYTCDTLKNLLKEEDASYFLILGADTFLFMDHWKEPEYLFKHSNILVSVREGHSMDELLKKKQEYIEKFCAQISFLPTHNIDISSTNIRERIQSQKSIRYLVPDVVREYIMKQHLYQQDKSFT